MKELGSLLRLAGRNLTRNKRRNLVTGFSVAAGTMGFILLGSYIAYAHVFLSGVTVYAQRVGHFSVFRKDAVENSTRNPRAYALTSEDTASLRAALGADPRVEFVGAYLTGQGLVSNGCDLLPFAVNSIDPAAQSRILNSPGARHSIPELLRAERAQDYGARLGEKSARIAVTPALRGKLGLPAVAREALAGAPVRTSPSPLDCATPAGRRTIAGTPDLQLLSKSYDGDLAVADVELDSLFSTGLALREDTGLLASTALLQELYRTDRLSYLGVFLREDVSIGDVIRKLRAQLGPAADRFEMIPYTDKRVGLFYAGSMGFLYSMAVFFFVLVTMVIAISIFNAVTLAFFERRREIGTLKAIGLLDAEITRLFVAEAALLAALAVAAGGAGSLLVTTAVNAADLRFQPIGIAGDTAFRLLATPPVYVASALLVGTATLAISFRTVKRFVRGKPVDLLFGKGQ